MTSSPPERWREPGRGRLWPQVRAALIVVHVIAITVLAFPAPTGGLDRRTWRDPTVQAEFSAWRERLAGLGVVLEQQEFEDRVWELASGFMAVRSRVVEPFEPYYRYCGTWQSWRMFIAPHTNPARLHIEVREAAVWRPVFVERSNEFGWLRPIMDQDRMRSVIFRYSWKNYAGSYKVFTSWVARQAARDFPEADRVRVSFAKGPTRTPAQVRAGEPPTLDTVQVIEHKLDKLR